MITLWWIWVLGLFGGVCWLWRGFSAKYWKELSLLLVVTCLRLYTFPLERHRFEGHEAEYIRYFSQELNPGVGDTASYPAMQIWWWLWGLLFSSFPQAPLWIASLIGSGSLILLWLSVKKIMAQESAPILFFWLVGLPLHWAWSLSAYNVIFPFFFVCLGLWALVYQRSVWSIAAAISLAAAMRMELALVSIPFLYWLYRYRAWRWSFLSVVLLPSVSVLGMFQVVIPGEGERLLAFAINWKLLGYHSPYHWLWPLLLLGCWRSRTEHHHWMIGSLLLLIGNHVVMSTFDDYASRHTLIAVLAMSILVGPLLQSKSGHIALVLMSILHCVQLHSLRDRWYAEPEAFVADLRERYPSISTRNLQEARADNCAWIAEENVFAADPVRSHFNLLDSREVDSLRGEHSCIDWCLSVQDWRWSSLGVQDRAYRITSMYDLQEKSLVQEEEQVCLQFKVGNR